MGSARAAQPPRPVLAGALGYGSVVGAGHAGLRHRLGEPAAGLVFFFGCQTMALSLFPLLGETPVPWRWGPRLLTVSLTQHAVYAATVAGVDALLARRTPLTS